jgi:transglutaminase-like putative cysteine protease
MKIGKLWLFIGLQGLFATVSLAQKPKIGKEPSWIKKNLVDYNHSASLDEIEDGYLFVSLEKQINLSTQAVYNKKVTKIITETGIQNGSEVSVSYDPSYQHVIFHSIHIIRGKEVINKLDISKMKIVQQETELSRSIYNGNLTSLFFLEDVRKSDVIEYDYTVYGFNPVFNGKYFQSFLTQFGIPINNLYYSILCPAARKLSIKNSFTEIQPVITPDATGRLYEWRLNNISALKLQDDVPEWYDPYPVVMISEFETWKEVSDWALPLFQMGKPKSKGLANKIEEIRSLSKSPEERTLLSLRFVQDEVRYLGIEMGINTHKPNIPDKIFDQRYGDCKDKTFLLCYMLQALGIEASPVLVNTTNQKSIRDWIPSPLAFNHATARVRLKEKYYWLDPTISFQRGGIDDISFPDYKCGLVLTDTTKGLTKIPLQDSGQVVAKELFTVKDIYGPAKLDVSTSYTGSFADDIRNQINSTNLAELQRSYLKFYDDFYKGTRPRDSLKIEDDEKRGTVITHEYYTIDKLWSMENGDWKSDFDGLLIHSILRNPKEHDRKMPLALTYPARYTEEVEVRLPESWNFRRNPMVIKSPAFSYSSFMKGSEMTLTMKFEYKALQDFVAPENAAKYFEELDKLKNNLGYQLSKNLENEMAVQPKPNSSVIIIGFIVLFLLVIASFVIWSKR